MKLTALHTLPFDAQIAFVQTVYSSQEERLCNFLDQADGWIPCWAEVSLEHWQVTCDGCGMHPLKGPRFKCLTCPDYDLCGQCFAKRGTVHVANHQFQCIMTDSSMWKRKAKAMKGSFGKGVDCKGEGMKGNSKGKFKGKCKGFWGMGWCTDDPLAPIASQETEESQKLRACATADCPFQATWHTTFCCSACKAKGNCRHGRRCEQKLMPEGQTTPTPKADDNQVALPKEEVERMPNARFSFPVVIGDSLQLMIEWDCDEDVHEVAQNFAVLHGIPPEELPTIVAFVEHANAANAVSKQQPQETQHAL